MADIKINVQVVQGQAVAAVAGLAKQAQEAQKSFSALNVTMQATSVATVAIGHVIGEAAVKGIEFFKDAVVELIGGGLQLEAQIENLTFKFQALLPATQDAKKFLNEIAELSDKSPFEFPELAQAANKLLVFGVESEKVAGVLKNLGDISAASGANIGELAQAFGKASEAGGITSRELNQFRNDGIPILQALADQLGVTTSRVKQLAGEGKINIDVFQKALQSLGEQGGFAFEAMANKALTLDGAQKRLHDSVESLERIFGAALAPAVIIAKNLFAELITTISQFLERTNAIEIATQALVVGFTTVVQIGAVLYNSFNGVLFVINELAAGITFISATVIGNLLGSLSSMIGGLGAVASALGLNKQAFTDAQATIDSFKAGIEGIPQGFHDTATKIAADMTATSNTADQFASNVENSYISLAARMKGAAKGTNDAAGEIERGLTEQQKEEQLKRLEEQQKFSTALLQENDKLFQEQYQQKIKGNEQLTALETLQQQLSFQQQADQFALTEETKQLQDAQDLVRQDIYYGATQEKLTKDQQQLALIQAKNNTADVKRQNDLQKTTLQIEQQKVQDRRDTFATIATLSTSGNKNLAAIGKAAGITQIAIDTPVAISKTLAAFPAPYNFVLAAVVGAAMAAQAARIAGVNFADGGIVPGSSFTGDRVPANVNSGEMILNRQQQAQLFSIANGGNSGGATQTNITVELDGEVVARAVSKQVANGLKLGEVV